jgi:hypothetical protein
VRRIDATIPFAQTPERLRRFDPEDARHTGRETAEGLGATRNVCRAAGTATRSPISADQ